MKVWGDLHLGRQESESVCALTGNSFQSSVEAKPHCCIEGPGSQEECFIIHATLQNESESTVPWKSNQYDVH